MSRWRDIPGYEGFYQVSDLGEVYSVRSGIVLKQQHFRGGYLRVKLSVNGNCKMWSVHVLVCLAFHGPKPFPKAEACHRDDVPSHNVPSNLYWGTRLDNAQDALRNGRYVNAVKTHCGRAGHEFTPENTILTIKRDGSRSRRCRACFNVQQNERNRARVVTKRCPVGDCPRLARAPKGKCWTHYRGELDTRMGRVP